MHATDNPFASLIHSVDTISCTGRRVRVRSLDYNSDLILHEALDDGSLNAVSSAFTSIIQKYIQEQREDGTFGPIENYSSRVLMAEEMDLLYLLRTVSYGSIAPFGWSCSNCKHSQDAAYVDTKNLQRRLFECSDPECPCHDINERMNELYDATSWDNMAWADDEWPSVPANHLVAAPAELTFKPDTGFYGPSVIDLEIKCRPTVSDVRKSILTKKGNKKRGIQQLQNGTIPISDIALPSIESLNWPSKGLFNVSNPMELSRIVNSMPRRMQVEIGSFASKEQGGIDNSVDLKCSNCGAVQRTLLPFSREYILPTSLGKKA